MYFIYKERKKDIMNITSWVFVYGTIDGKPMRWQMTVEAYNKLLQRINNDHNIVW